MILLPTRDEMRSMWTLAAPIALMQLGMHTYGVVDTLFMGRLGPTELAGVGLGGSTFFTLILFGMGTLFGVDSLSSQAFGAGKNDESAAVYIHALLLAAAISLPLFFLVGLAKPFYAFVGVDPAISAVALKYLSTLRWITLPFLLFAASRQYLSSLSVTRPMLLAIFAGNIVNVFLNYGLVFGKLGLPKLGVTGCAIASVVNSWVMLAVVASAAIRHVRQSGYVVGSLRSSLLMKLIELGLPAGLQMLVEVSMFSLITTFMSRYGPVPTAAHQITMTLVSITFMIPLGVSFAAAVRVGQAIGKGDPVAAIRSGRTALFMGVGFMCMTAVSFWTMPRFFAGLFTQEPEVLALSASFLFVGGLFQIFDGMQIVLNGSIRGLGETKIQLYAHLIGFGIIGLPLGVWLSFHAGFGPIGLWYGLLSGLTLTGVSLFFVWRSRAEDYLMMASSST